MSVDLEKVSAGDKLVFRSGHILTVRKIDTTYSIAEIWFIEVPFEQNWYLNGRYYERRECKEDIIEIRHCGETAARPDEQSPENASAPPSEIYERYVTEKHILIVEWKNEEALAMETVIDQATEENAHRQSKELSTDPRVVRVAIAKLVYVSGNRSLLPRTDDAGDTP